MSPPRPPRSRVFVIGRDWIGQLYPVTAEQETELAYYRLPWWRRLFKRSPSHD